MTNIKVVICGKVINKVCLIHINTGAQVKEFCTHGTKDECRKAWVSEEEISQEDWNCHRLHFRKIIQSHTDETLGDCSFLNTCFHMETCKYVHYEVDAQLTKFKGDLEPVILGQAPLNRGESTVLYPPQWIQCDLRSLDMCILGDNNFFYLPYTLAVSYTCLYYLMNFMIGF